MKVVVFRNGQLGDSLVARKAISKLYAQFGRNLIFLTRSIETGWVAMDEILDLPLGSISYYDSLGDLINFSKRSDLTGQLVYLAPTKTSIIAFFCHMVFFKFVCGYNVLGGKTFLAAKAKFLVARLLRRDTLREIEILENRVDELGRFGNRIDFPIDLRISRSFQLPSSSYGVINFSSKAKSKEWGDHNFCELLKALKEATGLDWVLIGDQNDRCRGDLIVSKVPGLINLVGHTTVEQLVALLDGGEIFVGLDSGPMHIADALGKPMVILFSAQGVRCQWFPQVTPQTKVFYSDVKCRGCGLSECPYGEPVCMDRISAREVKNAVLEVLRSIGK